MALAILGFFGNVEKKENGNPLSMNLQKFEGNERQDEVYPISKSTRQKTMNVNEK